jgi:heme oxygenase
MITLKSATAAAHRAVEATRFAALLLSGKVPIGLWRDYLVSLAPCYAAIEARHPVAARLARSPRILRDLDDLGPGRELPSTRAYVSHIEALPDDRVAAHLYVRWLGDLYGGSIMLRKISHPCSHLIFDDRVAAIADIRAAVAGLDEVLAEEANACFRFVEKLHNELA